MTALARARGLLESQGQIVSIRADDDVDGYGQEVEDLFRAAKIRISSYEDFFEAWVEDGEALGGSVVGIRDHDTGEVGFSVVVAPHARRRGIAKALVQSIIRQHRGHELVAWVVNPDMAKLLDSMGFDFESHRGWSPDAPHMRFQA